MNRTHKTFNREVTIYNKFIIAGMNQHIHMFGMQDFMMSGINIKLWITKRMVNIVKSQYLCLYYWLPAR